jgi:hypothetical protein
VAELSKDDHMTVTPPGRRSATRRTPEGLEISIPAKRNIFVFTFLFPYLIGWGIGEATFVGILFNGTSDVPHLLVGAWVAFWTFSGGVALYVWFWMLKGREILALQPDVLIVRREIWGVGQGESREYLLRHLKNLRVASNTGNPLDWTGSLQSWGLRGGPVAFDYGSQTIRVANGVDESEAREILRELKQQYPFPDTAA